MRKAAADLRIGNVIVNRFPDSWEPVAAVTVDGRFVRVDGPPGWQPIRLLAADVVEVEDEFPAAALVGASFVSPGAS